MVAAEGALFFAERIEEPVGVLLKTFSNSCVRTEDCSRPDASFRSCTTTGARREQRKIRVGRTDRNAALSNRAGDDDDDGVVSRRVQ